MGIESSEGRFALRIFLAAWMTAIPLTIQVALAGPLEDGLAAYEAKDYAAAYRLLLPLALIHR